MEFIISISRPGKSWNFSEGHGKAQYMLSEKKKAKRYESEIGFNFSRNKDKHVFYALECWKIWC